VVDRGTPGKCSLFLSPGMLIGVHTFVRAIRSIGAVVDLQVVAVRCFDKLRQ